MSMANNLERQIEKLVLEDELFLQLERGLSEFCPYESLGIVNAEIRHSAFLSFILDPYRTHGFGSVVLREVLDRILKDIDRPAALSRLDLHLAELDAADVRREWNRIDLLIILNDIRLVVALELKISATEHGDQLSRYAEVIERQWPSNAGKGWTQILLVLSRDGEQPSDDRWEKVTYDLIIAAIKVVLRKDGTGDPLARSMIKAYAQMLEKHHMGDTKLEELAQLIWRRHKEALEYLIERRPDNATELSEGIKSRMSQFAMAATVNGLTLEPLDCSNRYFLFGIKEWDQVLGMNQGTGRTSTNRIMVVQIENYQGKVSVKLVMGPGPSELRERFFRLVKPMMTRAAERLSEKWKTVDSKILVQKPTADEEFDLELQLEQIETGFKKFVSERVTIYGELLIGGSNRPK
jgi:hypothetical protein